MVRQSVWGAIVVKRCGFEVRLVCSEASAATGVVGLDQEVAVSSQPQSLSVVRFLCGRRCSQPAMWSQPTSACHEWNCVVITYHRALLVSWVFCGGLYNKSYSSPTLAEKIAEFKENY